MSILAFPDELLSQTFSHFELPDLCAASEVCRRFRLISAEDIFWKPFLENEFPNAVSCSKINDLPSLKAKFIFLRSPYGRMLYDLSLKVNPKLVKAIAKCMKLVNIQAWNFKDNSFTIQLEREKIVKEAWYHFTSFILADNIQGSVDLDRSITFSKGVTFRWGLLEIGKCPIKLSAGKYFNWVTFSPTKWRRLL